MSNLQQIEKMAERLSPEDQLRLLEHLARNLQQHGDDATVVREPQDFYGVWRDRFPSDFDLDGVLKELRSQWQHDTLGDE